MTVNGVDYSHYQDYPDVPKMAAAGIQFVVIKAWEGSSPDPQFAVNLANAQAAGMPVMAYVYLHADDSADDMQACFDSIGDTVLCLDWEMEGVPAAAVERWMDAYEARYLRQGMNYYGLYPPAAPSARIGQWPRWFPEYTSWNNLKLKPWDGTTANPDWRECWAIWQSSETGQVPGCPGNQTDLNQLAPPITIDDLNKWLAKGTLPPPRPDTVKPAIAMLQFALNQMGYDAGTVDGLWGSNTQTAINHYTGKNW
jgi:lysozyme